MNHVSNYSQNIAVLFKPHICQISLLDCGSWTLLTSCVLNEHGVKKIQAISLAGNVEHDNKLNKPDLFATAEAALKLIEI